MGLCGRLSNNSRGLVPVLCVYVCVCTCVREEVPLVGNAGSRYIAQGAGYCDTIFLSRGVGIFST